MPKKSAPKSTVETITPQVARKYLESNTKNRRVRSKTVQFYAKQMAEGEWDLTGEPIIFSKDGVLLNGQHRLYACIEADTPFDTFVIRGAPDGSFAKIDQNVPRQAGDIVGRAGYAQSMRKASAARIAMAVLEQEDSPNSDRPRLNTKIPHADILEFVEQHDDILSEACHVVRRDDGASICKPPGLFVGLYAVFALKNKKRAREFFEQLVSGEVLEREDPASRLRAVLISSLSQPNVKRKKQWILAVTIKAWNYYLQDRTVKQLKFSEGEKWPKIRARK